MNSTLLKYLLGALLTFSLGNSHAGIYLQVAGIEGEVTAKGHESWIHLNSASISASRINDKVVFAPIVITKLMDISTPALNLEALVGTPKNIVIHFVTVGTDTIDTYMEYELGNATFISVETNSSGERPMESYKVEFETIRGKFFPFDNSGSPGSPIPFGYDVISGTKI